VLCVIFLKRMMEQLVNFVIRPPRADYSPSLDLLEHEFLLKGRKYTRKDLQAGLKWQRPCITM
jgi:hypothetical protein